MGLIKGRALIKTRGLLKIENTFMNPKPSTM